MAYKTNTYPFKDANCGEIYLYLKVENTGDYEVTKCEKLMSNGKCGNLIIEEGFSEKSQGR